MEHGKEHRGPHAEGEAMCMNQLHCTRPVRELEGDIVGHLVVEGITDALCEGLATLPVLVLTHACCMKMSY